jgi:hypothetical protein
MAARPPIGGHARRRDGPWRRRHGASCGAWREKAQMNPRVRARAPKPVLFDQNPRVAVRCKWTPHV